ncbi:hypothetical protein CC79DRAFT_1281974 [Sarocladium strictum]
MAAPSPEPWCDKKGQSCGKRDVAVELDARWCDKKGQSCWKRDAAAEAFAEAIASSGGILARSPESDFSNAPGGASYYAKRQLNELAGLVALTTRDPEAFYASLGLENRFYADTEGELAAKFKRDDASPWNKRTALPEAEPWCDKPGQPCWKVRRDADPEAEPWCDKPGQSCWKNKRAEENDKRWCDKKGQSCWKAKRAAEAVLEALAERDAEAFETKPFDPAHFAKREAEPWCDKKGQSCWKREAVAEAEVDPYCMRPGAACWAAKRDVEAMASVARSIIADQ